MIFSSFKVAALFEDPSRCPLNLSADRQVFLFSEEKRKDTAAIGAKRTVSFSVKILKRSKNEIWRDYRNFRFQNNSGFNWWNL